MTAGKVRDDRAVGRWRAGIKGPVVFTNGVFDLLHAGHVDFIERARGLGVALVVGINSDRSARKLNKGPHRPVNGEGDRARVMAALAAVDCVVIFDEPTPERLIREIGPDILVKGADYELDEIPGRVMVEERGGTVKRLALKEGYSTTSIVERIRAAT